MEKRMKISSPALDAALADWREARKRLAEQVSRQAVGLVQSAPDKQNKKLLASGTPNAGAGNPADQLPTGLKGGEKDAQEFDE